MNRLAQRGIAVVLAMSVMAVAAIAATAIMVTQNTWLREDALIAKHAQAYHLIPAGIDWARALLSDDRRSNNIDHLSEPWALKLPPVPVDNGELAGSIEDQQGLFNLNNLVLEGKVSHTQLARLQRLLSILGLPAGLADAVADWIDADSAPQSSAGAEDDYYLKLDSPYLAPNQPLINVAELALVRGFDSEILARLRPFVSALPRSTALNANTASPEVLAAVVDGLSIDDARALVARRERSYFRNFADFSSRLPEGATVPAADIAVSSNYFLVTVRVTIGEAEARGAALLARDKTAWPTIMWRNYL